MKKLLSLLVVTVMLLATIGSAATIKTASASAGVKNVTMIAARLNLVGYDRYGRPLLDGRSTSYDGVTVNTSNGRFNYTTTFPNYPTCEYVSGVAFPWQKAGQEMWGRTQYYMPDARKAITNAATGAYCTAVTQSSPDNWKVTPYLWAEVWLTVKAQGGESTLLDKRYIVMDSVGQVWIDPDGRFNDCRYWDPANPKSTSYLSATIYSGDGTSQWNNCKTNPLALLDPSGENNTQGPYIFSTSYNPMVGGSPSIAWPAPAYQTRVYYWWYNETQNIDRVWRLGWANNDDYLRRGAMSVDGKIVSTGLVGGPNNTTSGSYYPGKPVIWNSTSTDPNTQKWTPNDINILGYDWDCGVGLVNFGVTERYVDLNNNNTFDYGEWVFLDNDSSNTFNYKDTRLVPYTIQWGGRAVNFREATTVDTTDEDLLWITAHPAIVSRVFPANIKHASIPGVSLYDQIYIDADNNNIITPNDIRLTNINYRFSGFGATNGGLWFGDTLIMLEVMETTCSWTYNVSVESDMWMAMEKDTYQYPEVLPSRTAAAFKTINGDINQMAQLVNKSTALDIDGKTINMPTTTFNDLRCEYREYLGLELFLDNGVDNNLATGGSCYALSLADDHVNFQAGEQFLGSQNTETALDINFTLTEFNNMYLYYDAKYDMRPGAFPNPPPDQLFYGCGDPIYYDLNRTPYNLNQPLQADPAISAPAYNPGVVNVGDMRMIEVTVSSGNGLVGNAENVVTYKAGSIVALGDLDYGRVLIAMPKGMTYYDEPHGCEAPNKAYDINELIYYDPAKAGGARAVRMIASTTGIGGTGGIETFDNGPRWSNWNYPFTGTSGSNWTRVKAGFLSWDYPDSNWSYYYSTPYQYAGPADLDFSGNRWGGQISDCDWTMTGTSIQAQNPTINYNYPYPPGMGGNSGNILYYNGLDQNGVPATSNFWNSYTFNFDYQLNDVSWQVFFKMGGIAAVYVQPSGGSAAAYTMSYTWDQWGSYSYYGWSNQSGGQPRIIMSYAWDYTYPGYAEAYARTTCLSYYDSMYGGDLFPDYTWTHIDSFVSGNVWTITIPNMGYDIQQTLSGSTTAGAAGLYHGNFYDYYDYATMQAQWDNLDIYYMVAVPRPGDRRRLTAPGHWVGANGYVLKKNDASKGTVTASTNSTSGPKPFGYFYPCGTKLAAGELYDVKSKVGMVTMGKNGDPSFMDIEILPGKLTVNVSVDGKPADPKSDYQLKVEQTSDITVSVDPAPKPGEKYIVKYNDLYQAGVPATAAYTGYVETREANTFSDSDPNEIEIAKESFNTNYQLYYYFSDYQPAGGVTVPELTMPFDFPFYSRVIPAGTKVVVTTFGYIRFDQDWYNQYSTYYYYWMRGAVPYCICPLGDGYAYWSLGWSPLSGNPVSPNLACFVSHPTAKSMKIRWATHYPSWGAETAATQATVNFSVTINSDGVIRFSYGSINDIDGSYAPGVSGIKGTGTPYSTTDTEYLNTTMNLTYYNGYNYTDDIVLTRTEFPPDPGRPAGGSTDQDYLIGSTFNTKIGSKIGGASVKTYEITPENPLLHIQYTPYRGSCQEDGSRDPIRLEVFFEKGGVSYPVPQDSNLSGERFDIAQNAYAPRFADNIYDPYWIDRPWTKKQFDNRYKGDKTPRPVVPASGIPTFACGLDDIYDCYGEFRLFVAPEELDLRVPDGQKSCISMTDLRFPNFTLKVFDKDNPLDVNDPSGMAISTTGLQPGIRGKLIANVNAHGAGIAYLCTAMSRTLGEHDRYIVQVNMDGSYTMWRWYEPLGNAPGAAEGALDPTDWLYSRRDYDQNTNSYEDYQGYGNALFLPWTDSDGFAINMWNTSSILTDVDCSVGTGICDPCHLGAGFPNLGDISKYDVMGRFNSDPTGSFNVSVASASAGNSPAMDNETDDFGSYNGARTYGSIETFGVPTMITSWSADSEGGEIKLALQPKNTSTPLQIRVYLAGTIFDYNSSLATNNMDTSNPSIHPPYFVLDDAPGIDYCGTYTIPVTGASNLNFSEFRLIDHGLQGSIADYTAGMAPLSTMDRPTKQLQHWYNPVCYNYTKDFRCYPGGESHTGRAKGSDRLQGYNAYPAINYDMYNKLGTEFYPLTDYGMYFILNSNIDTYRVQSWDRWTFDPDNYLSQDAQNSWRIIKSIEVTGPFMTPMRWYRSDSQQRYTGSGAEERLRSEYSYNGVSNVPIQYDTSGYIRIDKRNARYYELYEDDWTNAVNPGYSRDTLSAIGVSVPKNGKLTQNRDLIYNANNPQIQTGWYDGSNYFVYCIDEIIPIQPGLMQLKVTLKDGSVKIFQDCCAAPPTDGFMSHALGIKLENQDVEDRGGFIVDSGDLTLNAIVTEEEKVNVDPSKIPNYNEWNFKECNDAVVYAWQDTGVYDPDQKIWDGAGDGWCSGAPKNSTVYSKATQYLPEDDKNKDGKISYYNHETEIMGSYDLASGTWDGAFIDGRTFQRNNGKYSLKINTNGVATGFDFGGMTQNGAPLPAGLRDHVIGWDETLPVWIVAYKYGDDDNDRSFRPLYDSLPNAVGNMSHEVYLAGTRKFEVMPKVDLQFTYGPEPLTAGFTPELQNVDTPLTFTVLDANGKPLDLTHGIADGFGRDYVDDNALQNQLFVDPHPDNTYYYGNTAALPQYYWVRTDLHNFDGTLWSNGMQFSTPSRAFKPIVFDPDRDNGKYKFYGFCANDAGDFPVYVYTPDRRHCATTTVKVKQPHVEYKIRNFDNTVTFHDVGGIEGSDPDFVMTACDERIYEITVKASDALGQLIKGTAKEVSVCSGSGSDTTRFTPYVTRPKNFNFSTALNAFGGTTYPGTAGYMQGMNMSQWVVWQFLSDVGNRFFPFYAIDFNNDGKIDPLLNKNEEIGRFTFMHAWQNYSGDSWDTWDPYHWGINQYYYPGWSGYNTTNTRYDDGTYEIRQSWDLPPSNMVGYGTGCIYNDPGRDPKTGVGRYPDGVVFWDLNKDRVLTYQDSLSFNQNGEVSFFIYADDEMDLGGLVGNNVYSNSGDFGDVAGGSFWYASTDPQNLYNRYWRNYSSGSWFGTNDGAYRLDWDAFPDNNSSMKGPVVKVFTPETGEEMGKDLLTPEYYDITYGVRNQLIVKAFAADPRDVNLKDGSLIAYGQDQDFTTYVQSNSMEFQIVGRLLSSQSDPKAVETAIYVTPDGTGPNVSSLIYFRAVNWQTRVNQIEQEKSLYTTYLGLTRIAKFDVCKGLEIKAEPLNKVLKLGQPDTVIVTVTEAGTGYPYSGVKVVMRAEDGSFEMEATTNDQGQATFTGVKPSSLAKIIIKASKDGKTPGDAVLYVEEDMTPPSLDINAFPSLTNKSSITLEGTVTKGSKVKVGNVDATVDGNGAWKANITLAAGENVINIIAYGPNGVPRSITIRIVLDKEPPVILLPTQAEVDSYGIGTAKDNTVIFRGRVTPGSTITENDIKAVQNGSPLKVSEVKVVNDTWVATVGNILLGVPLDFSVTATDAAGNPYTTPPTTYSIAKITTVVLTIANPIVIVDGIAQSTPLVEPVFLDKNNNVMVPIGDIASYLGMNATQNGNSTTIVVGTDSSTITVGSATVTMGTGSITLKTPPVSKNGRIFVPVELVKQLLKLDTKAESQVNYEINARTIVITKIVR